MTECEFCHEPAQSTYVGRVGVPACAFHAGWYRGVISCAHIQSERGGPGNKSLAIEGLSFEDCHVPHAPKLEKP